MEAPFSPESGILSDAVGYMAGKLRWRNTLTRSEASSTWTKRAGSVPFPVKQHLKIKKFWGTSENAVRIQIYSAIIAYCMMAIVQKKMNIERSIYEMLQIVSVSLTDTTNLKDLFAKPNCNIVNELELNFFLFEKKSYFASSARKIRYLLNKIAFIAAGSAHAIFLYLIFRSGHITHRLCLQVAGVKPTPSHLYFDNTLSGCLIIGNHTLLYQ